MDCLAPVAKLASCGSAAQRRKAACPLGPRASEEGGGVSGGVSVSRHCADDVRGERSGGEEVFAAALVERNIPMFALGERVRRFRDGIERDRGRIGRVGTAPTRS